MGEEGRRRKSDLVLEIRRVTTSQVVNADVELMSRRDADGTRQLQTSTSDSTSRYRQEGKGPLGFRPLFGFCHGSSVLSARSLCVVVATSSLLEGINPPTSSAVDTCQGSRGSNGIGQQCYKTGWIPLYLLNATRRQEQQQQQTPQTTERCR